MPRARSILVVLLLVGIAVILFLPRRLGDTDVPFAAAGVTLRTYTESGEPAWEVHARDGEVIDESGTLLDVEVRFLSSDETPLTAIADRLSQAERTSTLAGSVVIERGDGLRLETEEITWNEEEEKLRAGSIRLAIRDLYVEGESFAYDLRAERATITGGVVATIDRDAPLSVLGERAEEADDVLAVEGNVRVEAPDATYRCHRIEADGETVRLLGEVEARFKEGELRADSAEIDPDGRVTATGGVSLRLDLVSEEASDAS
jgi:lipopolysaccharide assembly outer membrane protein LptD (OstA)